MFPNVNCDGLNKHQHYLECNGKLYSLKYEMGRMRTASHQQIGMCGYLFRFDCDSGVVFVMSLSHMRKYIVFLFLMSKFTPKRAHYRARMRQ